MVFGWVFADHQPGGTGAASETGASRNALATRLPAFFVIGLGCFVAALATLFLRRPSAAPSRRQSSGAGYPPQIWLRHALNSAARRQHRKLAQRALHHEIAEIHVEVVGNAVIPVAHAHLVVGLLAGSVAIEESHVDSPAGQSR